MTDQPRSIGTHLTGGAPTKVTSTAPKPFVFVLMPFAQAFSDAYTFGILGAAEDAGAYAERVTDQMFTEGILDRIFNQISKADVIIADMSGRNPNVFYEVGYAHALGKIVLLLTQDADDIPFDLKHRHHIVYSNIAELKAALQPRLKWAIAETRSLSRYGGDRLVVSSFGVALSESEPQNFEMNLSSLKEAFQIPIEVRNVADQVFPGSSHMYILLSGEAFLRPCQHVFNPLAISDTLLVGSQEWPTYRSQPSHSYILLDEFDSTLYPSTDSQVQCKLPDTLPPLPPGAVELVNVWFTPLKRVAMSELLTLRIHTQQRYYDFLFRLSLIDK